MGKFISLGEYNKLYKYIWIFLIIRFFYTFIFFNNFIFKQLKVDAINLSDGPFVLTQFDYIGYIIISIILLIIEKYHTKKDVNEDTNEQKLIFNEQDINDKYGIRNSDYFLFINIFFLVIRDILEDILPKFKSTLFRFWMFEMLFYELFSYQIFKTNIYRHHIFSFIFILISGCLLKSIDIIIRFVNNTEETNFFDDRKWLIPTSLIIFFLNRIFKVYTFINIKYYFDKRVISLTKFILLYGIIGLITTFIGGIISTYAPCGDDTLPELSKKICEFTENNGTIYYLDSYKIFYEKFSEDYLTGRIFVIIFRVIFIYGNCYSIYAIYQKLTPLYYICFNRLNVLILTILIFFNKLINEDITSVLISTNICDILILIFYILGSIIYLEFIELNFCNLNYYTKRNIKKRANREVKSSLDNIDVFSITDDSETN